MPGRYSLSVNTRHWLGNRRGKIRPVSQQVDDPQALAFRQSQDALNRLANQRYQLGDHMALHVLEALEVWAQLAQQPGHQGYLAARQQLQRFVAVFDQVRAVTAGIEVPRMAVKGGNGRA